MNVTRRSFITLAGLGGMLGLAACSGDSGKADQPKDSGVDLTEFKDLELGTKKWSYDEENDCYYRLGLQYCVSPEAGSYESLAIFVPGPYFKGEKHGDTYTCEIDTEAKVGKFTPESAPIVMPINSARLSAQACPSAYSYDGLDTYLGQGLVYVYAGFRGRTSGYVSDSGKQFAGGAPWPVVDLKAAVRYVRYNDEFIPGNTKHIFLFGYGAGGGVSECMGALGDCGLFTPYLNQIGAAMHDAEGDSISDAVYGSASWCPIMSYDAIDSSYEWMMGQFYSEGTRADGTWTKELSTDLANSYGEYLNGLGLVDEDDNALTLEAVQDGAYLSGTYYDYILGEIATAAETFFSSTTFPYTYTPGHLVDSSFPGDPNLNEESAVEIDVMTGATEDTEETTESDATTTDTTSTDDASEDASSSDTTGDSADGTTTEGVTLVQSTVYDSAESYVSAINGSSRWLTYSPSSGDVTITSLWDFVTHCRPAEKGVCAFDALDRSTTSNQLFGVEDASSLHFDETIAQLLSDNTDKYAALDGWDESYVSDWAEDIVTLDSLETDMESRVNAMNPLYGVCEQYAGYGSCTVAPYWRINSGLFQTATALTTEANVAISLKRYDGVKDVSFTPVWGKGFELAEVEGDAQDNFVSWVVDCCS